MSFSQRSPLLVAKQLGVDVASVTSETQFAHDLGADFLDRVELMPAIEDRFVGLEITDDDVEQIQVVGDLIRDLQNKRQVRPTAVATTRDLEELAWRNDRAL
jgi:acyl carrier protein